MATCIKLLKSILQWTKICIFLVCFFRRKYKKRINLYAHKYILEFFIIWKRLGKKFTIQWQYNDMSANFFLKGKLINLLGCRPYGLCSKYSTVLLYHKSSSRQHRNQWVWLCASKTFLFIFLLKQVIGLYYRTIIVHMNIIAVI